MRELQAQWELLTPGGGVLFAPCLVPSLALLSSPAPCSGATAPYFQVSQASPEGPALGRRGSGEVLLNSWADPYPLIS